MPQCASPDDEGSSVGVAEDGAGESLANAEWGGALQAGGHGEGEAPADTGCGGGCGGGISVESQAMRDANGGRCVPGGDEPTDNAGPDQGVPNGGGAQKSQARHWTGASGRWLPKFPRFEATLTRLRQRGYEDRAIDLAEEHDSTWHLMNTGADIDDRKDDGTGCGRMLWMCTLWTHTVMGGCVGYRGKEGGELRWEWDWGGEGVGQGRSLMVTLGN